MNIGKAIYRHAHGLGAAVATLVTVFVVAVFYDTVVAPTGKSVITVMTKEVEPGKDLVLRFLVQPGPRECPSVSGATRLVLTDGRGIEYEISMNRVGFTFVGNNQIDLTVPVPQQSASGMGSLEATSLRRCSVLGVYDSEHRTTTTTVPFTITATSRSAGVQ